MKHLATTLFFTALTLLMYGQQHPDLPPRAYTYYPTLKDMYGFAVGVYQQQYLILGGRVRTDVPEIYPEDFPNTDIILVDLPGKRATAFTSNHFEGILGEQMAATGPAYYQDGATLYLLGGYGYSEQQGRYLTFPYLTAIDLPRTIEALIAGKDPMAHTYQICDERLALFNATLDYKEQIFFLINGKYAFKLDPFEENAEYVEESRWEEMRTFRLTKTAGGKTLTDFRIWYDLPAAQDYFGPLLPTRIDQEIQYLSPDLPK